MAASGEDISMVVVVVVMAVVVVVASYRRTGQQSETSVCVGRARGLIYWRRAMAISIQDRKTNSNLKDARSKYVVVGVGEGERRINARGGLGTCEAAGDGDGERGSDCLYGGY